MPPQTTVASNLPIGIAGQLADEWTAQYGDVQSVFNQEAAAHIPFGIGLKRGTADDTAKLPTTANDVLVGVSVFNALFNRPTDIDDAGLLPGIEFGVLRRGKVIVLPEDSPTPASGVHMRIVASGGNTQLGAFTGTAEAGKTVDCSGFARWTSSAGGVGLPTVLEIDIANSHLAVAD